MLVLFCVDVDKSRVECRKYLEEEAVRVYGMGSREVLLVRGDGEDAGQVRPVVYESKAEEA